jgi:hypothetical protein
MQVFPYILDLISLLSPLASHRPQQAGSTPRKHKRRKTAAPTEQHPLFKNPPPLVSSITIGFNSTIEHLESEIQNAATHCMRIVFVARGDTSSTILYSHLPIIASMLPCMRLVSLTKGAEAKLCETLRLKRVGVIGLLVHCEGVRLIVGWYSWCRDIISTCRGESAQIRMPLE